MTKKNTEVGDVWKHKSGEKYYIYNVFEDKLVRGFAILKNGRMDAFCHLMDDFVRCYTYLGKSKTNISKLFEVKND